MLSNLLKFFYKILRSVRPVVTSAGMYDNFADNAKGKQSAKLTDKSKSDVERGILLFEHTGDVIRAEQALKAQGFALQVKAPPPELRSGCDLVIEFPLIVQLQAMQILEAARITPLQVVPVTDVLLEPVSVFQTHDYGAYLMVRAANMKITVEKSSLCIVNVSGGGCPDVPYLASLLVGQVLTEVPPPLETGRTLCGYALQLAFAEARRQLAPTA